MYIVSFKVLTALEITWAGNRSRLCGGACTKNDKIQVSRQLCRMDAKEKSSLVDYQDISGKIQKCQDSDSIQTRMAGFEESLVSPAKRDQNEMGGLQK